MTTYKTGNPIGSKDPRDLYDNAENLDEAVNTRSAESWNDRFGVARKTWWGMEQDFQQFLINSGYQNIGDYGPGLEITARNQIFWRDGELYRAGAALELPYTATGDWGAEEGMFVAVGDAALRQELSSNTGSQIVSYKNPLPDATARTIEDRLAEKVSVKDFGAIGDGETDDTAAIFAALETARVDGGVIYFPKGTYLTDPIDLRDFFNVVLLGENETSFIPYKPQTTIKIRTAGVAGILLADTGLEVPVRRANGVLIKNIFLDCNHQTTLGINAQINVTLENFIVRKALGDGIVFEGESYPIFLKNVWTQQNGGNGIFAKGPFTTIYSMDNVESGFNGGYGALLKDGNSCVIKDLTIQSNKRGGLLIYQDDPANFNYPIFLGKLLFINLYTEDNGTLDVSDPLYNGNFALDIAGQNWDGASAHGKIPEMTFINAAVNHKPELGSQGARVLGTSELVLINCGALEKSISSEYNYGFTRPYLEGVFNPSMGQSGGPYFTKAGNVNCHYARYGRQVTCNIDIGWSDKGSANGDFLLLLDELPFAPLYDSDVVVSLVTAGSTDHWSLVLEAGSKGAKLRKNNDVTEALISDISATGRLRASFSYIAED